MSITRDTIKVWCTLKHDDHTVIDLHGPPIRIQQIQDDGGFWSDGFFVPWHRINCIKYIPLAEATPTGGDSHE